MRLFQLCDVNSAYSFCVRHLRSLSVSTCSRLFCVDATSWTCGYPIPGEGKTPTTPERNESSELANDTNQDEMMQPRKEPDATLVAAPYTLHHEPNDTKRMNERTKRMVRTLCHCTYVTVPLTSVASVPACLCCIYQSIIRSVNQSFDRPIRLHISRGRQHTHNTRTKRIE